MYRKAAIAGVRLKGDKMAGQSIKKLVAEETSEFFDKNGYELYNVEFVKEGSDWFLRVYIDMIDPDRYVGTEDCEKVSRYLSDMLDKKDPVSQSYYLEVSSPGMDRTLLKDADFEKYAGKRVELSLYKARYRFPPLRLTATATTRRSGPLREAFSRCRASGWSTT